MMAAVDAGCRRFRIPQLTGSARIFRPGQFRDQVSSEAEDPHRAFSRQVDELDEALALVPFASAPLPAPVLVGVVLIDAVGIGDDEHLVGAVGRGPKEMSESMKNPPPGDGTIDSEMSGMPNDVTLYQYRFPRTRFESVNVVSSPTL
jgi:hypothetical protein